MIFDEWFNHPEVQASWCKRLENISLKWNSLIKQDFEVCFKNNNLSEMSLEEFNGRRKQHERKTV